MKFGSSSIALRLRAMCIRAIALAFAVAFVMPAGSARAQSVLTYHGDANRSGNFVMPALTWAAARSLTPVPGFAPKFQGNLYAQPLYWHPSGAASGMLVIATENNTVVAIDAVTGKHLWARNLGRPVPLSSLSCGNIDPLGVTGTPVIDETTATLYLDAMVGDSNLQPHHRVFALSLTDGSILSGWPVDVGRAMHAQHLEFDSLVQNQRGALALLNGTLYVPYGGHFGDCGNYHGVVVGLPLSNPQAVFAWRTRARGGGIWAPGGLASDGQSLYAATGNTEQATSYGDGEGIFRLAPDLQHSGDTADFFAARNWRTLDANDLDIGGTNPLLVDLPTDSGIQPIVLALGKDGRAYVVDRNNLGGIGGQLLVKQVSPKPIRTAPATYVYQGLAHVAFRGPAEHCPGGIVGDLTVLEMSAGTPPTARTAWCGAMSGAGSPIVTTTDGTANPIVWILGAEGDNRLHGFRGNNGAPLFTSQPLAGLRHFQTLIAADNRLFVGADGTLYAFAITP